MSEQKVGSVGWIDLTVDDAEGIRDFYQKVVGWDQEPLDMGDYSDFVMKMRDGGEMVSGICHARGSNARLPRQWLIYIVVENLDDSVAQCTSLGGELVIEPKTMGDHGRYCVIRDPAGAVASLFEPKR